MQVNINYLHKIDASISKNSESKESLAKCILSSPCKQNIILLLNGIYIF